MGTETRSIKIRVETHRRLKVRAAELGISLLDLIDLLASDTSLNVAANVAAATAETKQEADNPLPAAGAGGRG